MFQVNNGSTRRCSGIFIGTLSGLRQFLATESPLKVLKKCFLFHLKSFFRSQNIEDFGFTFWSCIKMA